MDPEKRKEQILRVAARVFAAKGYHGASISDIIEAAGVARGTFYLYFQSKREIFEALVDSLAAGIRGCLHRLDLSAGQPPWIEQLRDNIKRLILTILEQPELTQIVYSHNMGLDAEYDRKLRHFYAQVINATEAAFLLGQQMGLIRKDIDTRLAAIALVGSAKEVLYRLALNKNIGLSVDQIADEMIGYTVKGIFVDHPEKIKNKATPKKRRIKK